MTRFRTSMIMQVIFIGTALVIVVTTLAGTLASGGSTTGVVVVIVMFVVIALLVWWILRRRTLMVIAVDATTRAGCVEKPARGTDAGWRIPLSDITRAHVAMHTKWVGSGDARTQKKRQLLGLETQAWVPTWHAHPAADPRWFPDLPDRARQYVVHMGSSGGYGRRRRRIVAAFEPSRVEVVLHERNE
ncbi:hypothetical protein ABLE94_14500 [Gordonia sp. VNK1]|uniref:hypothetical protein n=1 Tax=Gordonia oleivorans TaxID=3156618 RepID=UPI0032B5E7C9